MPHEAYLRIRPARIQAAAPAALTPDRANGDHVPAALEGAAGSAPEFDAAADDSTERAVDEMPTPGGMDAEPGPQDQIPDAIGGNAVLSPGDEGPRRPVPTKEGRAWGRGARNMAKPQYIDFTSPMLLSVLEHALSEVPEYIAVFEERYPLTEGLPSWNGQHHAAELVLEFDTGRHVEPQP
jgi:hypothetical protein